MAARSPDGCLFRAFVFYFLIHPHPMLAAQGFDSRVQGSKKYEKKQPPGISRHSAGDLF